jgi:hypothetical protein
VTRLRHLTARDLGLLAAALALLPVTILRLRVAGFTRQAAADRPPRAGEAEIVRATEHMVAAAAQFYRASCLPQSITLQWLLKRQGIATRLCVGVRKNAGVLAAHAWVEYRGQPLIDSPAVHDHYAVLEPADSSRPKARGVP